MSARRAWSSMELAVGAWVISISSMSALSWRTADFGRLGDGAAGRNSSACHLGARLRRSEDIITVCNDQGKPVADGGSAPEAPGTANEARTPHAGHVLRSEERRVG